MKHKNNASSVHFFFPTLVRIFYYRSDCFSCLFIWGHSSTSERPTWGDISPLNQLSSFYLFIPLTAYLFLIPLMWCHHSLLIVSFKYLYICITFPLSFFFCDLTFFMDLIPFTCNYSCCLFVFLHFLFGFLVLHHLRHGCLLFGGSFSNIVFLSFLFVLVCQSK